MASTGRATLNAEPGKALVRLTESRYLVWSAGLPLRTKSRHSSIRWAIRVVGRQGEESGTGADREIAGTTTANTRKDRPV